MFRQFFSPSALCDVIESERELSGTGPIHPLFALGSQLEEN